MMLLLAQLLTAGCQSSPARPMANAPGPTNKICPACHVAHYEWTAYRRGTPVFRSADIPECSCCQAPAANLVQTGIPQWSCSVCGKDMSRCPMCRAMP